MLAALSAPDIALVVLPVAIALVVIVLVAAMYNALAVARVRVRNAFSQIDVQLRRRHDLVPNLVEIGRAHV